jgi:hypothetical protein
MRPNRHPLDEDSASRLLQGLVHPDDAPPGYGAVAGLLTAAAQLPLGTVDEDAADTTVSAMVEVIRDAAPAPQPSRRKTMLGKLLAGKALAAVAVIGLTASGAAAATGTLPDQAQGVVSDALSHVGLNVPHPTEHGNSAAHRQDGKDHQDADENEAGDDNVPSGDQDKAGLIDAARNDAKTNGTSVGAAVCDIVSHDKNCKAGEQHPSSGDHGAPAGDERGKSGEDHPTADDDQPTTPDTPAGSIETGAEHSTRTLPSGKGKPE